ncbi:MAG: hypothetical protein JKY55_20345 [Aliivibrio sp.]|uniref:hypothetical protein n=1 Tax=Aliivibrio sp. TaxID=1872443 RepID=UPI001A5432A0|nr:hypothetical protein [Aliivibrio sp.]
MRPEVKAQLDSALRKNDFWKLFLRFLLYIVFPACCFLIYLTIDPSSIKGSDVIGVSINRSALLHDEGHTNYLYIRVEGIDRVIRVSLPRKVATKVGAKVMLRKLEKPSSKKARYKFLKYVD